MLIGRRLYSEANRAVDAPPDFACRAFAMWQNSETEARMAEGRLGILIA
jgi:hypothetical protein